jgi:hypothetical protein
LVTPEVKKFSDLQSELLKWEVITIEWNDVKPGIREAYLWAKSQGAIFKSTIIPASPKEVDDPREEEYSISFEFGKRVLKIANFGTRVVFSLTATDEYFERKDKESTDWINRLLAQDMLK